MEGRSTADPAVGFILLSLAPLNRRSVILFMVRNVDG